MSNFPDLESYGYHCVRQLGGNFIGGRRAFLAVDNNNKEFVIKQFLFATPDTDWTGYKYFQREIEILEKLDHPFIPKLKNSFQTEQGFCIVFDYILGTPISQSTYSFESINKIAIAVLKILIYLQQQSPAIIHRDIKPDNIIEGVNGNYYLIDFGFASLTQSLNASSTIAGTMGFIPPEQLIHQKVNKSSDLYSLGVTLYCLINNISSDKLNQFIDCNSNFFFDHLKDKVNIDWLIWISSLLEKDYNKRPTNAVIALCELEKLKIYKETIIKRTEQFQIKSLIKKKRTEQFQIKSLTKEVGLICIAFSVLLVNLYIFINFLVSSDIMTQLDKKDLIDINAIIGYIDIIQWILLISFLSVFSLGVMSSDLYIVFNCIPSALIIIFLYFSISIFVNIIQN